MIVIRGTDGSISNRTPYNSQSGISQRKPQCHDRHEKYKERFGIDLVETLQ